MNADARRKEIQRTLTGSSAPVSATTLAQKLNVSRQVIVGDIALLRAKGANVIATPRGYLLQYGDKGITHQIACAHYAGDMRAELDAIVDQGCRVIDVIVEHPLYGEIRGDLLISTRRDVTEFVRRMELCRAHPLLIVTGGVHLHTIEVPDQETLALIRKELRAEGLLVEDAVEEI